MFEVLTSSINDLVGSLIYIGVLFVIAWLVWYIVTNLGPKLIKLQTLNLKHVMNMLLGLVILLGMIEYVPYWVLSAAASSYEKSMPVGLQLSRDIVDNVFPDGLSPLAPSSGIEYNSDSSPSVAPTTTYIYHKIQSGETWQSIAGMYGVPVGRLQAENQTSQGSVGDVLSIPANLAVTQDSNVGGGAPATGDTRYVVKSGETAQSIADAFGVTLDSLLAANGVNNPGTIVTGDVLNIP